MKLYGALILFLTLSTAYGLRCYFCVISSTPCTEIKECRGIFDRCSSLKTGDYITKDCAPSSACVSPMNCCEGDLCNSAVPTGPSVVLLLVSSAIVSLFL